MAEAQVADAAAKARFRIEGRQLYNPPAHPDAVIFPDIMPGRFPSDRPVALKELTHDQLAAVQAMFVEADERRARTLNVEEVERSIALCRKTGVRVPKWMLMALDMLNDERRAKYGHLDRLPSI